MRESGLVPRQMFVQEKSLAEVLGWSAQSQLLEEIQMWSVDWWREENVLLVLWGIRAPSAYLSDHVRSASVQGQ